MIERKESAAGGVYPHIVTWLDDENKCAICGQYPDHENHVNYGNDATKLAALGILPENVHKHEKSKNEVAYVYERLKGIVLVKFKKDCLDLPEVVYQILLRKIRMKGLYVYISRQRG